MPAVGFAMRAARNLLRRPAEIRMATRLIRTACLSRAGEYEMRDPQSESEVVRVTFVMPNRTRKEVRGKIGDIVMFLAHKYNIEIEGACEGSCACSTCHVYVDDRYLDKLEEPTEEEEDMLDMAPALKTNSRLACQIRLTKEMDGMVLTLPPLTRNFYVDGHIPQSHN